MSSPIAQTRQERIEQAIIATTLLVVVVLTFQPILNLVAISISEPKFVPGMSGLAILPQGFSLDVWDVLLRHPAVLKGLYSSLFITIVGTALNLCATILAAWALSRPGLPGRRSILVFILITLVFEPGIVPDYFVMKKMGLLNSYASVILYKLVNGWYLVLLIRFFEEVPAELLDAAAIDGAGPFQTLWKVAIPVAAPAIATVALSYLVFHWNEYFRAMIYLSDPDKWPLQVVLRQFVVDGDKQAIVGVGAVMGQTGAANIDLKALKAGMIVLTILPILAIYPLILKFFSSGTLTGAVKG